MEERRSHQRYTIDSLEYITVGDGNGGVVVDIGPHGLRVQTVAPLQPQTTIPFSVAVAAVAAPIEGSAEVIWVTRSGQAGLRIKEAGLAHQQIATWISAITSGDVSATEGEVALGPNAAVQPNPNILQETTQDTLPRITAEHRAPFGFGQTTAPAAQTRADSAGTNSRSAAADPAGPFALSEKAIETCIRQRGWGVYTLGRFESNGFLVLRVGRSSDLADDLYDYVGEYEGFSFAYAASEKRAFHQECELYHRLRPAMNKFHPSKPANADWNCPVCRGFS